MTRPAAVVAVVVAALALLLTGCSRELVTDPAPARGPGVATSPDAARVKLRVLLADACYTDPDPRQTWTRCGRWVEEAASTGRAASTAIGGAPVTGALGSITAGRDAFVARGCTSTTGTVTADVSGCVAALLTTRTGVTDLAAALGGPGG